MTPSRIDVATMQRRLRMIQEALKSLQALSGVDDARLRAEPLTTGRQSFLGLATLGVLDPELAAQLAPAT